MMSDSNRKPMEGRSTRAATVIRATESQISRFKLARGLDRATVYPRGFSRPRKVSRAAAKVTAE